jgi:hypothetical protein
MMFFRKLFIGGLSWDTDQGTNFLELPFEKNNFDMNGVCR